MHGKFIVIYGSNNLGKSVQFDLLEAWWKEMERPYTRLKYPIYDSPTGIIIDKILRHPEEIAEPVSENFLQWLFAENRREFEPQLCRLLQKGDVLAEDYVGTGLAWGLTREVPRKELDDYNWNLRRPDIEVLLTGVRYSGGIEKGHRNEDAGNEIWWKNQDIHIQLGHEFGWQMVNASQGIEAVHRDIREVIMKKLS